MLPRLRSARVIGSESMGLDLETALAARRAQGLYRSRRVTEGPQGPELVIDGRRRLAFCANDYLGLAADPRLAEAMRPGVPK